LPSLKMERFDRSIAVYACHVTTAAPPLMTLVVSQSLANNNVGHVLDYARTPTMRPFGQSFTRQHLSAAEPDFGVFRCCQFPKPYESRGYPLADFTSSSEFDHSDLFAPNGSTSHLDSESPSARQAAVTNHLQRLGPFSVLPARWSLQFLALSTATKRCALRVLHPPDALLPT
jgi:hypothetical protein